MFDFVHILCYNYTIGGIMTIRKQLASAITHFKTEHSYTYESMCEKTGLNKTQLTRIIKKDGEGVSIDLMEEVCLDLNYRVDLTVI